MASTPLEKLKDSTRRLFHQFTAHATNQSIHLTKPEKEKLSNLKPSTAVNATITVPAANWSSASPFTQVVSCTQAKSIHTGFGHLNTDNISSELRRSQKKACSYIDKCIIQDGSIALYCYDHKPDVDFQLDFILLNQE